MTLVSTAAKAATASGRVVLFDSTLGADAASIDSGAASIAAGYNAISIMVMGRTTQAVVSSGVWIRVNNDSGANYDQDFNSVVGATPSAGTALAQAQWSLNFPGASMDAGSAGLVAITVVSYDQTTFHKVGVELEGVGSGTAGNNWVVNRSFRWRNTAAITRVAALAASGNLLAGTRLLVLGG